MNKRKKLMAKRRRLAAKLTKAYDMLNVYPIYRKCGKKNCKCQKGDKHGPVWRIHYKKNDELKVFYIPQEYEKKAKKQSQSYKRCKDIINQICEINRQLLKMEIRRS